MRIMGLDYGSKTVGVALSDPLFLTAQGHSVIYREREKKVRQTLARIDAIIAEYEVSKIVLGYPRHLDGSEGERCLKTMNFKEMLEKRTRLPVMLWDEQLTTVEALLVLDEAGIQKKDRKLYVDKLAAVFILREYLESAHRMQQIEKEQNIGKDIIC